MQEVYTNQTAFSTAVVRLMKQNCQSMVDSGGCKYFLDMGEGKHVGCGIGLLIEDKELARDMDKGIDPKAGYTDASIGSLLSCSRLYGKLPFFANVSSNLLKTIQSIHDYSGPGDWLERFRKLADEYSLEMPTIKE